MNQPCPIPEAAAALGVHPGTISRWLADGAPVFQRGQRGGGGKKTLVIPADLQAWRSGNNQQTPAVDQCELALGLGGALADITTSPATVQAVLACYLPQAAVVAAGAIERCRLGSVRDELADAAWTAWRLADARHKTAAADALVRAWYRTMAFLADHHGAPVEGGERSARGKYEFPERIQRLIRAR